MVVMELSYAVIYTCIKVFRFIAAFAVWKTTSAIRRTFRNTFVQECVLYFVVFDAFAIGMGLINTIRRTVWLWTSGHTFYDALYATP